MIYYDWADLNFYYRYDFFFNLYLLRFFDYYEVRAFDRYLFMDAILRNFFYNLLGIKGFGLS